MSTAIAEPSKPAEPKPAGASAAALFSSKWSGKTKEPKAAAPAPPTEPVKPAEEPATPTKPAEKKKPVVAPAQPVAPDYEKMGEAVGKAIAPAIDRLAAKPTPAAPTEPEISARDKEQIEVLERMGKDYPELYGKTAKEYAESLKKSAAYQSKWEKENTGKEFDAEAEEHNEFFSKNEVEWDDYHFDKSVARIEAERATEKASEKTNAKLKEVEHRERAREATPKVVAEQVAAAKDYFTELGADFAGVLDENGNINRAEIKKLTDADPLKTIALQGAEKVETFRGELYKLVNGLADFDEKNKLHATIAGFVDEQEAVAKALPADQQVDEQGRRFATAQEYNEMPADKRKGFWRLTEKELSRIFIAREAEAVKATITAEEARLESYAKSRGYAKNGTPNPPAPPVPPPPTLPATTTALPPSPSGAVEPRMAQPVGGQQNNRNTRFSDRFRG